MILIPVNDAYFISSNDVVINAHHKSWLHHQINHEIQLIEVKSGRDKGALSGLRSFTESFKTGGSLLVGTGV